jgi:hypothetical protein
MTSPWWTFRQGTARYLETSTFMVSLWGDHVLVDDPREYIYSHIIWYRILEVTQLRWPVEYAIGDLLGLFDKEDQNVRR